MGYVIKFRRVRHKEVVAKAYSLVNFLKFYLEIRTFDLLSPTPHNIIIVTTYSSHNPRFHKLILLLTE